MKFCLSTFDDFYLFRKHSRRHDLWQFSTWGIGSLLWCGLLSLFFQRTGAILLCLGSSPSSVLLYLHVPVRARFPGNALLQHFPGHFFFFLVVFASWLGWCRLRLRGYVGPCLSRQTALISGEPGGGTSVLRLKIKGTARAAFPGSRALGQKGNIQHTAITTTWVFFLPSEVQSTSRNGVVLPPPVVSPRHFKLLELWRGPWLRTCTWDGRLGFPGAGGRLPMRPRATTVWAGLRLKKKRICTWGSARIREFAIPGKTSSITRANPNQIRMRAGSLRSTI